MGGLVVDSAVWRIRHRPPYRPRDPRANQARNLRLNLVQLTIRLRSVLNMGCRVRKWGYLVKPFVTVKGLSSASTTVPLEALARIALVASGQTHLLFRKASTAFQGPPIVHPHQVNPHLREKTSTVRASGAPACYCTVRVWRNRDTSTICSRWSKMFAWVFHLEPRLEQVMTRRSQNVIE